LDHRADINAIKRDGLTPIHCACVRGHIDIVQLLINRGATIKSKSKFGRTPLHEAAASGNFQVCIYYNIFIKFIF
jgi:ankyrin repeat protein